MKQSLQLRIGQSLTMTPQLQQAIKLLQLSSLELQTEIQQTLETNPLLEHADHLWPRQVERAGCTLSLQLPLEVHQNLMVQAANFLRLDLWRELTNQTRMTPLVRQRDAGGSKRRHDRIQLVT